MIFLSKPKKHSKPKSIYSRYNIVYSRESEHTNKKYGSLKLKR